MKQCPRCKEKFTTTFALLEHLREHPERHKRTKLDGETSKEGRAKMRRQPNATSEAWKQKLAMDAEYRRITHDE